MWQGRPPVTPALADPPRVTPPAGRPATCHAPTCPSVLREADHLGRVSGTCRAWQKHAIPHKVL